MKRSSGYEKALKHVRQICLALPEAKEVEAWGHPTFRAGKKMFAGFGEDVDGLTIGLAMGYERQEELLNDERFFPTPYAARVGLGFLHIDSNTDYTEHAGLIQEDYRQ